MVLNYVYNIAKVGETDQNSLDTSLMSVLMWHIIKM